MFELGPSDKRYKLLWRKILAFKFFFYVIEQNKYGVGWWIKVLIFMHNLKL